jgi:hypothetical protein
MGAWAGEARLGGSQLGDRRAGLMTSGGAGDGVFDSQEELNEFLTYTYACRNVRDRG